MRKILVVLLIATTLLFGGRWLRDALASDETKIRWLIEDTVEAYNEGRAGGTVACLADDWKDGNTGLDKATLRLILARTFMNDRDAQTRELTTRVVVDEHSVTIAFPPEDEDAATVSGTARFSRRIQDEWRESWVVSIEGDLRRIDGDWKVVATERISEEGRRP